MKQINFKTVKIKNFLSIGNDGVEVKFTPGVHIITGINRDDVDSRNAVGKTSTVEAIYFAIFGHLTKSELKKDLIPNRYTNKTCSVELDFEVIDSQSNTYKVTRTISPSKLFLFKNGEDVTRDSIKNTEQDIHNLISASPSIFSNCVIMTLSNTTPFMAKSKVEKRKFIEGIFGLEVFSKMMLDAREEYNSIKRLYEIELTKYEDFEKSVKSLETTRQSILKTRTDKIENITQRKKTSEEEKEKFTKLIGAALDVDIVQIQNNIDKLNTGVVTCKDKIKTLSDSKNEITSFINIKTSELSKIQKASGVCPTCNRELDNHNAEQILLEKNNLQTSITELKKQRDDIIVKISEFEDKKTKIETAIKKYNDEISNFNIQKVKIDNAQSNVDRIEEWLKQLDKDIKELQSTDTDVDDSLSESRQKVESIKGSLESYRQKINLLDVVKHLVSEEGVKSYIVKQILKLFNGLLKSYLQKLGATYTCMFDEYFEETIVDYKSNECSYFNFSGAESKKIDCACLFTFMDMRRLQGGVSYNINIYDELFDSSLDAKGIEYVNKILNERVEKYNECIFVISHRVESIQYATGDVIFLEKKDNVTKRIDYNPFV